jgi:hypothetical protein
LSGFRLDIPWQQFLDAVDQVLGDAWTERSTVGFRVDSVQLGGSDQTVKGTAALSPPRSDPAKR